MAGYVVIGSGKADSWSKDASAVEKTDVELRTRASECGLFDMGHDAGICDREQNLIGEGWLLVVGDHVERNELNRDPAVVAYCDA